MRSSEEGNRVRWGGEPGFFEIWFLVVFDPAAPRAWWLRYTTFAPAPGQPGAPRATLWAAAFDARAPTPARAGKRILPLSAYEAPRDGAFRVRLAEAELGNDSARGACPVGGRPFAWDLYFTPAEREAVRAPELLHRLPLPTNVSHANDGIRVNGWVALDGVRIALERAPAVQKHIWGTRRVEELFWLYCPLLDDGGAIEATGVRVRRDRGPRIAPVWLRTRGAETSWWNPPGILRRRVVPDGPGRLRVRAASATAYVVATATCDPATLVGYVYRDPSGFDVYVAQSDVATCEVAWCDRRHRLARWNAPRHARGARTAIEFHERTPLPGVRYVRWDATTAEGGEPCRPAM